MNRFELRAVRMRHRIPVITLAKRIGIEAEKLTRMESGKVEITETVREYMEKLECQSSK